MFTYKDISVEQRPDRLIISNSKITRELDIANGYPRTVALAGANGRALAAESETIDFNFMGYNMPGRSDVVYEITNIECCAVEPTLFEGGHVRVCMDIFEPRGQLKFRREYIIYPEVAAIAVETSIVSPVEPNVYWTYRSQLRCVENRATNGPHYNAMDAITPAEDVTRFDAVEFLGRTDNCDVQVYEHPDVKANANGNILYCSNSDGSGFAFLQEAPPSVERRDLEEFDFHFGDDRRIASCCWGVSPHEVEPGKSYRGYRHIILVFNTPREREEIIFNYLKARYPDSSRKHAVMVNPWGCGGFPSRVSEEFLVSEVKATAKLGAECYQIDDGWQRGNGLWDLLGSNFALGNEFWEISTTRLKGTFAPMRAAADKVGVELALWTAPFFNVGYRDSVPFGDMILKYHREWGFNFIKVDSMVLRDYAAEQRLTSMFRRIREESNGEIFINLDVTNGQRGGFFYLLEYGNLFLQNRYVSLDIGIGYHPEKTLNSLWRLARYTRAQYLQIEIPYHAKVNEDFYTKNMAQRPSPSSYPQRYWAAIALFADPLLWFAPSDVVEPYASELREVMELHKKYRDKIFAGDTFPVGQEPNGKAVTGLWSRRDDGGMLVVYRELGSENGEIALELPGVENAAVKLVHGNATAEWKNGALQVTIPAAADFALFEY